VQTKPTAFFMFPNVAKNACGFAHKQTLCSQCCVASVFLAPARKDLAGISHIFVKHTHQKEFQGSPREWISAKSHFICC
jgi:hypothetical protein